MDDWMRGTGTASRGDRLTRHSLRTRAQLERGARLSVAPEYLLELRGTRRRTLHADRVGLAYTLRSARVRWGGQAVRGERSARVSGVHLAFHVQRAAEIGPVQREGV